MTNSRPFGIPLITTILLLVGLLRTIAGILLMANTPLAKATLEQTEKLSVLAPWSFQTSVLLLVLGLLGLLASYGVFTLKGWAWIWTTFVVSVHFSRDRSQF